MYQEEINRFPPVFHVVGEKREIGFKFYIIFNAIYALTCIILLNHDLPLMFSKLGIIIVVSIALMFLIDKEKTFGIFALLILSSLLLVAKAPMILWIFFALGIIWTTIATMLQYTAFHKAQRRSAELYKLQLEHTIYEQKKRNRQMEKIHEPDYSLPDFKYCPVCGFSIPEGEEVCLHCNPKDEEPPKPSIGKYAAQVNWPTSNSGQGLKKDDASPSSSDDSDVVI